MSGPGDPTVVPPPVGTDEAAGRPSLGDLISAATQDLSLLLRQEVELAKAELAQSAKRAGAGGGMLAGAGVAGHFVLLFASLALWWALPIGKAWSAVVVALIWGVVAAVLAARGRHELRRIQGAPRTAETVKKIPNALKGDEEANHE